ncbi:hypothetical protein AGMMS49938_16010 [Fibrobacterales bacterium]|nr:hypothetical protein AGMMS49938_16010 [Fibrobacterales bacterium]
MMANPKSAMTTYHCTLDSRLHGNDRVWHGNDKPQSLFLDSLVEPENDIAPHEYDKYARRKHKRDEGLLVLAECLPK